MKDISYGTNAVEIVDALLTAAVARGASDIHIDPVGERTSVRFRCDGLLAAAGSFSASAHLETIARLKILSGVRTDIRTTPQDGRWRADISGSLYNIRASFMPAYHGENAVLRLLPARDSFSHSLESLGFSSSHIEDLQSALAKTSGLILVAGPTGSGKTTTLRACLAAKSLEPISVMTLEDPVEYEVPGVRQIHIRQDSGVTFAAALRAALRQDPDVIMVGEIRDGETARVAIHTALTGHLVLSTIHTNSALESIPRLIDMGVDAYLLASTISLVVAQRLARTICSSCGGSGSVHRRPDEEYGDDGGRIYEDASVYARCDSCRSTGWQGRSVIAEVLKVGDRLKTLISAAAPLRDMLVAASEEGFIPMTAHGEEKVACGISTNLEIKRILMP